MNKTQISIKVPQVSLAAKLEDIKTSIADINITEIDESEVSKDDLKMLASALWDNLNYMYSIIDRLSSRIYENNDQMYELYYSHLKGHLPPINSAEQMQTAIEALGLSKEYQIAKKTIYASDGSSTKEVLEISK